MNEPLELFTARLRELRDKSGLGSIDDAASKLGVSRGSLGGYERGKRLPDIDFLARLALATGADLNELIALRLRAGGQSDAATQIGESPAEYMAQQAPEETAAHARQALMAANGEICTQWSLAIMELAARGDITDRGVDRLIDLVKNWIPSDRRVWDWIDEHFDEVGRFVDEHRDGDRYG